jgi:hypothetical protein
VTELHVETMSRVELIAYLADHVYPRAGARYKSAFIAALADQPMANLLGMAKETRKVELEREEKRRQRALERRMHGHNHTTTRGAR